MKQRTHVAEDPDRAEVHHQVGQHAEDPDEEVSDGEVGEEEVGDGAHPVVPQDHQDHHQVPCKQMSSS